MDTITLQVHERKETGDGPARRLRARGMVPGVTYGKGKEPMAIAVALDDLRTVLAHGHNVILELEVVQPGEDGKEAAAHGSKAPRYAVVKQVQTHPISRQPLHVDLHEVDLGLEIEAPVAIEPVGVPVGVADGGIIEWERREVTVKARPGDIPPVLELDVSGLHIGQHLSVAALPTPPGVTIVEEPDTVLVAVVPPRVERAAVGEAGEEAAEPGTGSGSKSEE